MAHEISFESGRAEIAYAGETPWHALGTRVDGLQTAQDMLAHAGLLWTVGTRRLFAQATPSTLSVEATTHRAIVREDTECVLGVVSDRYRPIQNTQAADVVDALVAEGGAHVEVAGALGHGERCWMLSRLPGDFEVVKGDVVSPYFLLAWGHDGKHGLAGQLTPIRVVCNNTLSAAGFGREAKWSTSADVYVRHSVKAHLNIEEARRALGAVKKQAENTREAFQALARPISAAQVVTYFQEVFPEPDESIVRGDGSPSDHCMRYEAVHSLWQTKQARLLRLFAQGAGADIPGVRGTAWGAYNAVTEYTDHIYPILQSGEVSRVRQQSALFGAYADLKNRALQNALALVGR